MALSKRLKTFAITHAPGQVGITLVYTEGPSDHVLLAIASAREVLEKLSQACDLAAVAPPPGLPSDRVGVSDHVSMSISPPSTKGH